MTLELMQVSDRHNLVSEGTYVFATPALWPVRRRVVAKKMIPIPPSQTFSRAAKSVSIGDVTRVLFSIFLSADAGVPATDDHPVPIMGHDHRR